MIQPRRVLAILPLALAISVASANATDLQVISAQADAGASVEMCVALSDNRQAAALQFDLTGDSGCTTPLLSSSGNPQCNGAASGKPVVARVEGSTVRVILLSLAAPAVLPNGPIACCSYVVAENPTSSNCPFALSGVVGSTTGNVRIGDITGRGGVLSVRQTQQPSAPSNRGDGGIPAAPLSAPGLTIPNAAQPNGAAPKAGAAPATPASPPAPTSARAPALAPLARITPEENSGELPAAPTTHGGDTETVPAAVGDSTPSPQSTVATKATQTPTPRGKSTPAATIEATRNTTPTGIPQTPTPAH